MTDLREVEEKIKLIETKLSEEKANREKYLGELKSLYEERIELLKKHPTLVSTLIQSTTCPLPTDEQSGGWRSKLPSLPGFLGGSNKAKKEEERNKAEFERNMRLLEEQRKERQRRNQAEQDALNQRIANTAKLSQQKNRESLWKHDQEMKEQLDDQSRREAERQRESEKETMEMERRIREETRRLEEERRLARDEEERKNSEWRRKKAQESYHQEQRTSEIISESQRSLDQQAAVNRQKHLDAEKNLNELKAQYSLEREAMLRELRQIEEEVKRSQEECRRKYEELRRRSEEQLEEMVRLLKLAQWSRSIEENWSNRLKALKSTDRRVYRAMGQLRMRLAVAKVKELNVEFIRREMDRLKTEVSEVKTVMDREVKNLDDMYQFSGKQFVLDIANSLSDISTVCSELNSYLDSQHSVPKFEKPEASEFYKRLEDVEKDLREVFNKIPEMSSLKSKYSSGFNMEEQLAIEDVGSFVQIEEIE